MKTVVAAFLGMVLAPLSVGLAGSGRQTDTIEVDYDYRVVSRWLERNEKAVVESTGAEVVKTAGDLMTLRKETKHGLQVFRTRREGRNGFYRATFVDRSEGELTNYSYELKLSALANHRTEITITMTATAEKAYTVTVNVELRRSLRGLRSFLQEHLVKPLP